MKLCRIENSNIIRHQETPSSQNVGRFDGDTSKYSLFDFPQYGTGEFRFSHFRVYISAKDAMLIIEQLAQANCQEALDIKNSVALGTALRAVLMPPMS